MRNQIKKIMILIVSVALLVLPAIASAAGEPRLQLSVEKLNVVVGQEISVALWVENAPLIYGVESHLVFDPAALEVVSLEHGDFLSPDPANEAFILQNQADNEAGTLDYALALLNPAPPVEGDGLLASITFQAKADGSTTIQIKEALFGTQTGEEIVPVVQDTELTIIAGDGQPAAAADQPGAEVTGEEERLLVESPSTVAESSSEVAASEETSVAPGSPAPRSAHASGASSDDHGFWLGLSILGLGVIVAFIGLVGFAGLIGGWFWMARARRR
jgi:hypothetical protein